MDPILEFIKRRFSNDCDWRTTNCYYFALILKDRFKQGEIYYDVIDGHFVFKYGMKFYDWSGVVKVSPSTYRWETFRSEVDAYQYERIIRDVLD